jgi:hypothetical protein
VSMTSARHRRAAKQDSEQSDQWRSWVVPTNTAIERAGSASAIGEGKDDFQGFRQLALAAREQWEEL